MIDLPAIRDGFERGEFFLEYLPNCFIDRRSLHGSGSSDPLASRHWRYPHPTISFRLLTTPTCQESSTGTGWSMRSAPSWVSRGRTRTPMRTSPSTRRRKFWAAGDWDMWWQSRAWVRVPHNCLLKSPNEGYPTCWASRQSMRVSRVTHRYVLDDVTLVGGANLAILTRSNFDAIKLDKSLIDQLQPERSVPSVASHHRGVDRVLTAPRHRRRG